MTNHRYGCVMEGSAQHVWYVLVEGQSYGPYTPEVMINFVSEGRIIASSLISQNAQHGYIPASNTPMFQHWINKVMQSRQNTPVQSPAQSAVHSPTVFIVMAEIDPKTGMNFLRALQTFGHVQRIGDSVWLLKGQHRLDEVKSALAATLTKRDRLFIHDCFANQQDWVNIGADLDGRITQMWQSLNG